MPKKGRLGKDECEQMRKLAPQIPVEHIAARLDRTVDTVREWISANVPPEEVFDNNRATSEVIEKAAIRQELRSKKIWRNLKDEFLEEELEYFEEQYVSIVGQFNGDVLPTEETQIFMSIKCEILMSRILKDRKKNREDAERLLKIQAQLAQKLLTAFDEERVLLHEQISSLESQVNTLRELERANHTEYKNLYAEHGNLSKNLKATRDQRIDKISSNKIDFLSVIVELEQRDVQEREARMLELTKLATQKQIEKFAEPNQYEDGSFDLPILSDTTLEIYDAEHADGEA